MSKKPRINVWWFLVGLLSLFLGLYGFLPLFLSWFIERELEKNGFERATVEFGYPHWKSTSVQHLSFQKTTSDLTLHLTVQNVDLEYHISQLFSGTLERINISNASVEIFPNTRTNSINAPTNSSHALTEIETATLLTVEEIIKPLPTLPFQQLIVENVAIKRAQATGPFQQLRVSGSLINEKGTLTGKFMFEGESIPRYELLITGKKIGDMRIALQLPSSPTTPVISFQSNLKQKEEGIQLQGTFETDVKELLFFLGLLVPISSELETVSGKIAANWSGSFPKATSLKSVLKEKLANTQGTFRLHLDSPKFLSFGKDISIALKGEFTASEGQMTWILSDTSNVSAQIEVNDQQLPEKLRSILPEGPHPLLIDLPKPVRGHISLTNHRHFLTVDGAIRARHGTSKTPLNLQIALNNLSGQHDERMTGKGNFTVSALWRNPTQESFPVKKARCVLTGKVSVNNKELQITLASSSILNAALQPLGDIMIPRASLILASDIPVVYLTETGVWKAEPARINIQMPELHWKGKTISIQETKLILKTLRANSSTWKAEGGLHLGGLSTQFDKFIPPTTNWKFNFSANPAGIIMDLFGQTLERPISVKGQLQQNFETKEGALQLMIPSLTFSPTTFFLSQSLKDWPYPFDVTSGQLSASANVSWNTNKSTSAKGTTIKHGDIILTLEHLGGHYKKMIMNDLTTTVNVVGVDTWSMPEPAKIMIKELRSGIDFHNLTMTLQASANPTSDSYLINITDFSTDLLGGKLSSEAVVLDSSRNRNSFTANLQHLEVEEILKLEQQKGLQGTGILDGVIPVLITKEGVEVHEGKVEARPPGGLIRFQPSAETTEYLSQANSNMNLVLQALSNFHYDVLKVGVNYQQDGTLNLQMRLEGKNPNLRKGQPIHFNLNIEENIPALLKSLQVVTGIEEQVEHMLQKP